MHWAWGGTEQGLSKGGTGFVVARRQGKFWFVEGVAHGPFVLILSALTLEQGTSLLGPCPSRTRQTSRELTQLALDDFMPGDLGDTWSVLYTPE